MKAEHEKAWADVMAVGELEWECWLNPTDHTIHTAIAGHCFIVQPGERVMLPTRYGYVVASRRLPLVRDDANGNPLIDSVAEDAAQRLASGSQDKPKRARKPKAR